VALAQPPTGLAPPVLPETAAQRRRADVALRIERAAMALFAARPMTEVKVEEIAAAAGVALRTLYRYFPTKEEIFTAYPRREAQRLGDRIKARPAGESPLEATRRAIEATIRDAPPQELAEWLAAVIKSPTQDRIARVALVATADALSDAFAERVGAVPEALWPAMAGAMVAAAIDVGTRQWLAQGGRLLAHHMAAIDVAGAGLDPGDNSESSPSGGDSRNRPRR
jgi:AcrR family transcriptional regulator